MKYTTKKRAELIAQNKDKIEEVAEMLKKYSKEELKEMAHSYDVQTNDGNRDYPLSWIRFDIATKIVLKSNF